MKLLHTIKQFKPLLVRQCMAVGKYMYVGNPLFSSKFSAIPCKFLNCGSVFVKQTASGLGVYYFKAEKEVSFSPGFLVSLCCLEVRLK